MGLLYTFRIGLWNIGIEGQVIAGAMATTAILKLGLDAASPGLFITLAIGSNRDAAYLFGLKPDRFMLLAMVLKIGP